MIKSMTGFGRSETRGKFGHFIAEIRTLNHKFLEPTYKLPNSLSTFDEKVKDLIKSRVKRGKVYLSLMHEGGHEAGANIFIDEDLAKSYHKKLKKLKNKLNIEGPIRFTEIISLPDVINQKPVQGNLAKMWPFLKKAVGDALDKLVKDREKEGHYLFRDLVKRKKRIKKILLSIKKSAVKDVSNYKKKLSERIKQLTGGYPVDKGRIEMEVALFAKNSDITEELTRLNNHIANFTRTIGKNGEVGKKLDFIAQELHREANTIGSKSSGLNISRGVIEMKTEIEKIREQLKNIE